MTENDITGEVVDVSLRLPVRDPWLGEIAAGRKTVEGRAGPARKWLRYVGQRVTFFNKNLEVAATIEAVRHYPTLPDFVDAEGWQKVAPHLAGREAALAAYKQIYPEVNEGINALALVNIKVMKGSAVPPLCRNNTSYPTKVTTKLRELYSEYKAAGDSQWVKALKYYQYLVRAVMSDPEYGIGADGNARGILLYGQMGIGKTRTAVAVAMALWDTRPVVVLLPRSTQKNFRDTVDEVIRAVYPEDAEKLMKLADTKLNFVSMDAYNSADQMGRVGTGDRRAAALAVGGLDGKLLIVDEAHNFFRAIINSSAENANARRMYDMIQGAKNLRILFLTGTPASKDPFELVPCFNMLAGMDLLPTQYEVFYELYVDKEKRTVKNRERLANRLVGLVSHVGHARPSEPKDESNGTSVAAAMASAEKQGLLVTIPRKLDKIPAKLVAPTGCTPKPNSAGLLWLSTSSARPKDRTGGPSWYEWAHIDGELSGAITDDSIVVGYEIDQSRLLLVDSKKALDQLVKEYGCVINPSAHPIAGTGLKWGEIAAKYAGIIFNPYDKAWLSKAGGWYDAIEAVTYCVWDESVIKRRVVLREQSAHQTKQPGDDGWFPVEKPMDVKRVEMSREQYRLYLLAREKEEAEGKAGSMGPHSARPTPPLSLPGSEKKAMRSYYVKSRTLSLFSPGHRWETTDVDKMPDEVFTREAGPKLFMAAEFIAKAPGPVLVYSQFVESGLKPLGRYLQKLGYTPAMVSVTGGPGAAEGGTSAGPTGQETDDFPYRSSFMPPPLEMYARLREIAKDPAAVERKVEGYAAIVVRSFPDDYENTDSIADHFAERARIKCRERGQVSPADAWAKIRRRPDLPPGARERRELVYAAARGCNLFNCALAVDLIARFKAKSILDVSAGWGDRLIAAFAASARTYRGWDPNPELQAVYSEIAATLPNTTNWEVACAGFETAEISLTFDLVLFSPPFFDQELYQGEETSTTTYPAADEWYEKFYRVAIAKAAAALKPGGRFLAYIHSRGRMLEEFERAAGEAGLTSEMRIGFRQDVGGAPGKIRDVFVWRKAGTAEGGVDEPEEKKQEHYAIISGEVPTETRGRILQMCVDPKNAHGEKIKGILVSKTGAEGLDLKYLREAITLEPYWDQARIDQVKARAVRLGSHDLLPKDERVVQPRLLVAAPNKEIWEGMLERDREPQTIDEVFYARAAERHQINEAFRQLLVEVSLECSLFGYGNCRVCIPTGAPLFHDDPALDIRLPDPCSVQREAEIAATKIEYNGITYYYVQDPAALVGFRFYVHRADLGGYTTVDPSDPVISDLVLKVAE